MVALVLLPGLDGTGHLFADFAASFEPEIKVIVAAYPPDLPLGYVELENIARTFLPPDEPYFLLAESFSGPIGISIAADSPPGLLGLILCCSFARNPLPLLAPLRFTLAALPIEALPVRLLGFFLLGRFATVAHRHALGKALKLVSPAVLRARAQAALTVDVSAELRGVKVPVLYLQATEDRIVPRTSSALVVSLAPQCQVISFAAPHFLLQVLPSQAAESVAAFFNCDRSA